MKFTKFGKALLMSALSAGVVLSVTSCIETYTVGFLYVTGTQNAQSSQSGIISGFKIDHNTGYLTPINGLPVSTGGSNPVRAVLISGQRYLYVLNRGMTASGSADCTSTDPCQGSNVTVFAVGANGILTPQGTYYTQGKNPFRLAADPGGQFLYVLDHDSPNSPNDSYCNTQFGSSNCGDITAFQIDPATGRLQVLLNHQATGNGVNISYFPVPPYPVDFVETSGNVYTLSATAATASAGYPYLGGSIVYPYTVSGGQLSYTANSIQSLNIAAGTAIDYTGGYFYVLDNEGTLVSGGATSQILPYSAGSNGALQPLTGGAVADDAQQTNPIAILTESKNKWTYVANMGNPAATNNPLSGLAGWINDPSTHQLTPEISGSPWGTGAGPQCLVEDPSDQYFYTANLDGSITGRSIDQTAGVLRNLVKPGATTLNGPATWCLIDGRTN